jgi:threonine synthase
MYRSTLCGTLAGHSWTHQEGWREWPDETPPTIPTVRAAETVAIPTGSKTTAWEMRGVRFSRPPRTPPGRKVDHVPADALKCKECSTRYPLEARYVCERCFGPLEVAYAPAVRLAGELSAASRPGPTRCGATPTSSRSRPAAGRAADGLDARSCGPTGSPGGSASRRSGSERDGEPDPLVQGPGRLRRPGPSAGARLRHRGLRVDGEPRQRGRRPRGAAGLRPTSSSPPTSRRPRSSRRGVRRPGVGVRGNYDDVNRLCTELSGDRPWAFVNVNVRPYSRRAPRHSPYETADSSAGSCPTGSWPPSPRAPCSPRWPAASRTSSTPAW